MSETVLLDVELDYATMWDERAIEKTVHGWPDVCVVAHSKSETYFRRMGWDNYVLFGRATGSPTAPGRAAWAGAWASPGGSASRSWTYWAWT